MKTIYKNNSILSLHYSNYLKNIEQNKNLISYNLTNAEVMGLYDKKYNLNEFEIYKYLTVYDYIHGSLGCGKYKLTEGITANKNKYNNILIDLYYKNICSEIIMCYPISIVFKIKKVGSDVYDLTKKDMLSYYDWEVKKSYTLNFKEGEINLFKSRYKNYSGNSYTYYIFKQLIKLYLTEVYLYKHQGFVYTYSELIKFYYTSIFNKPKPYQIQSISDFIEIKGIEKIKYQCIKVIEPQDINYDSISDLKLKLVDVNTKGGGLIQMYDSIVEKRFLTFWDYEETRQNREFTQRNKLSNLN